MTARELAAADEPPIKPADTTSETFVQPPPRAQNDSIDNDRDLRHQVGRLVVDTQQTIDSHLALFRVGLLVTVAASIAASVKLSGLLRKVRTVDELPLWHFAQRKKLRVRMIRQSRQDPSVFYVYHTPFVRRTVLRDELPPSLTVGDVAEKKEKELLAVRPFGVQVDESSEEWVWSNFVSSHRYMTIHLLQRINAEGGESVATCNIALGRPPFGGDLAQELVSHGHAECIPENLENYDNGSDTGISTLAQRLKKLEAAQKHAKVMQYGIWKDWQEEKLSDRVLSAGKRATSKGFKKLVDSIRH
ncbi:hypothetical protein PR003_g16918 [Phytophthora rubi]|uniref:Uncharacterized protein n=1 Tax=Phytophthora rubi TaxID=129364 RepID=A0A6A3KWL8_9STRA|nr:hypothetical protein PR001_g16294 [Phytophthora rubi]KAE9012821.1 hypothetical protein PR002_g14696 [Phytophthora rubi]KAE9323695.1 hypothetical protein PR003_g16918 [Phytophthora rubi]